MRMGSTSAARVSWEYLGITKIAISQDDSECRILSDYVLFMAVNVFLLIIYCAIIFMKNNWTGILSRCRYNTGCIVGDAMRLIASDLSL
jgi:hypothetical protein